MDRRLCIIPVFFWAVFGILYHPQEAVSESETDVPVIVQKQRTPRTFVPKYVTKKSEHHTAPDWRPVIDSTWGEGLPTDQKLHIFDTFWATIDEGFACFQDLDVNWDSLGTVFRREVEHGVSRGRFAAIMNHLALPLQEAHTNAEDKVVTMETQYYPGVPLLVVGGWGDNGHFGAGLTPLPDSTLLVYKTVPDHPFGLVPGDIVLGYEGIPWRDLYKDLLSAQLPIAGWWWGCSESAHTHSWLMSAGMNWHLFDTIDIIKHTTGDTVHLSVSPLIDKSMTLFCTEQMDVPGVPMPDYFAEELFSYGIIDGTAIGYIYGWGWFWDAEQEFLEAVESLMFDHHTDGMIIDFRMNYGGNMFYSNKGLRLLFNSSVETIGFDERCHPHDHFEMCPSASTPSGYIIHGDPATYYDRPIALLTGPGAVSSGDQVALRVKFHPMVRVFGKSTSAAFGGPDYVNIEDEDWYARYVGADSYLARAPGRYLTRDEFEVDKEVWLTPDDVAQGKDTVVEAAIEWIQNCVYADFATVDHSYAIPGLDTLGITANVINPRHHPIAVLARVTTQAGIAVDSEVLCDDGHHNDWAAGDGIWGGLWTVVPEERSYSVDVVTHDLEWDDVRVVKRLAQFTTVGPVVSEGLSSISQASHLYFFQLELRNNGSVAPAENITAEISSKDTCILFFQHAFSTFNTIPVQQNVTSDNYYMFQLNPSCRGPRTVQLDLSISSNGYPYWSDSVFVTLTPYCHRVDCNGDAAVNILDAVWEINCILGVLPQPCSCDCNEDGTDDLFDVVFIVNVLLGIDECTPGSIKAGN